ncbi:MAG: hypothetical protein J6W79_00610, partial [Alphaproteobacteria bacterium]|nr:hypothetical protein [Alphaproteobacteria bacterium]
MLLSTKLSWCLLALPLVGCTTVPTNTHDNRLNHYTPKITANDFDYDPMETPIAKCYTTELTNGDDISGATLIDDGISAFVMRAA